MTGADVPLMGAWTAAEGWTSETAEDFQAFLDHDPDGCLILERAGEPAAVCMATCYGEAGFLGEMIVSRRHRGLALGPLLFDLALSHLRERGCRSVSLDAVPTAAPVYAPRGVRFISLSRRFRGRLSPAVEPGIRPLRPADMPEILALDRRAFGADRSFFLQARRAQCPDLAWVREENGRIAGYLFGRRRLGFAWAGPLWAADSGPGAAALLRGFAAGAGGEDIQAGVLDIHAPAVSLMRELGFEEKRSPSRRMSAGDGPPVGLDSALLAIGTAGKG